MSNASNVTSLTNNFTSRSGWDGSVVAIGREISKGEKGQTQKLKTLGFGNGELSLSAGKTGTVNLEGPLSKSGKRGLLIAQANNLFPIASVLVSGEGRQELAVPQGKPLDVNSSKNALEFLKSILANPESELAKGFFKVSEEAASGADQEAIKQKVESYFAGTGIYTNIDLDTLLVVCSYLTSFPTAWADFRDEYSYDLHTTGRAWGAEVPKEGGVLKRVGKITFTRKPVTGIPSPEDQSAGYEIVYTPMEGKAVKLAFANGILTPAKGEKGEDLILAATYIDSRLLSEGEEVPVGTSNGMVAPMAPPEQGGAGSSSQSPAFVGTVGGNQVLASPASSSNQQSNLQDNNPSNTSHETKIHKWFSKKTPLTKSVEGILSTIAGIVGILVIYVIYRAIQSCRNNNKNNAFDDNPFDDKDDFRDFFDIWEQGKATNEDLAKKT